MLVVFGSLNVDMVMAVQEMPRPGDTILCNNYHLSAGGKGANQAVAAVKAGAAVRLFGAIGSDEFGRFSKNALKNVSLSTSDLLETTTPTGCAMICVDSKGENMITVASGANLYADSSLIADDLLGPDTTILLQMEVPADQNWALIERARAKGAMVILNSAPARSIPDDILRSLSVLVMNQIEATVLALDLGFDVISPTIAARRIAAKYGIICIVTLGGDGAFAATTDGAWSVPAMDIQAVDTTGAGDAFCGVLAASLDQKMPLDQALRRAAVASGLACLIGGAGPSMPDHAYIDKNITKVPAPRRAV